MFKIGDRVMLSKDFFLDDYKTVLPERLYALVTDPYTQYAIVRLVRDQASTLKSDIYVKIPNNTLRLITPEDDAGPWWEHTLWTNPETGLTHCTGCMLGEGALTTHCPGTAYIFDGCADRVHRGELDFYQNKWVFRTSPHSPKAYIDYTITGSPIVDQLRTYPIQQQDAKPAAVESNYKWATPYEWFEQAFNNNEIDNAQLLAMLAEVNGIADIIQDNFQSQMIEDGYFKEVDEDGEFIEPPECDSCGESIEGEPHITEDEEKLCDDCYEIWQADRLEDMQNAEYGDEEE